MKLTRKTEHGSRVRGLSSLAFAAISTLFLAGQAAAKGFDDGTPAQTPTNEILVKMVNSGFAEGIATKHRLGVVGTLRSGPDWVIFRAHSVEDALRVEKLLKSDPLIEMASNNYIVKRKKLQAFTPDDPFYYFDNPIGSLGQWNLSPNATGRPSINAQSAWSQGARGTGVRIGFIDDGFDFHNPDLTPGFQNAHSKEFEYGGDYPVPVYSTDNHGTAVAGLAVGRGGNGIGIAGVAPNASWAGLRCNFITPTAAMLADATLYESSGDVSNRFISIKNHGYGPVFGFVAAPAESAALTTSTAAGTIHLFGAGNERQSYAMDNGWVPLANDPNVITVAALGPDWKFAPYSSYGSNNFCTAPSGGSTGGVLTTDRVGNVGYNGDGDADSFPSTDYTSTFSGTSAATPLVAGALALVKEKNPALDVRLAKFLLAKTCKVVDPWDATEAGGWVTNGAGYRFNRNYGFGLVHAGDLLSESRKYYSMVPRGGAFVLNRQVGETIPDNNSAGITKTFTVGSIGPLESVRVKITLTHTFPGDITVWLTSPFGTKTKLVQHTFGPGASNDNLDWWFTTNAFYGESGQGTWTITVADEQGGDVGTWDWYNVALSSGGPVSRLGSNVLTYNGTTMQLNSVVNGKLFNYFTLPPLSAGFKPVAIGDVDYNGRNDIVMFNPATRAVQAHLMYVYESRGVKAMGTLPVNTVPFAVADINKDGRQDLCIFNTVSKEIGYYQLVSNGSLSTYTAIGVVPAGTIPKGAVDSTGDGQPDIILDKTTGSRAIWVWQLSAGGAPFGMLFSGYQAAGYELLNAGDINFDNQPDFLAKNTANGSVAAYTMNILTVSTIATVLTPPSGSTPFGFVAL